MVNFGYRAPWESVVVKLVIVVVYSQTTINMTVNWRQVRVMKMMK